MAISSPRLALIGTGRWGKNIAKTLRTLPMGELRYEVTREWQTLLERDDIDGVLIATPPNSHAEIATAFIERGRAVFIEKPLASTLAEAKRIAEAAKRSEAPVMVGHLHLYNPAYQEAKRLARESGALHLLIGEGVNTGPYREDYSAMWDWAPHDLSMMLDLMGEMPQSVAAWGVASTRPGTTLYDFAQMRLDFASGTVGIITSSWLMPQKRKRLTIVGEKSNIVYDDVLTEKKVARYEKEGTEITYPKYEAGMPLTLELEAFIRVVQKKEEPRSGVAAGLNVVAILDAAERSIAASGTVVLL